MKGHKRIAYLDSGSLGISPGVVTRTQIEWLKLRNRFGPASGLVKGIIEHGLASAPELMKSYPHLIGWSGIEHLREKVALTIGCEKDEISWAQNTTDAIRAALLSLQLTEEDEILTTDIEHDSTLYSCAWACHQWKTSLAWVRLSKLIATGDFAYQAGRKLEEAISERTRVVILSHIAYGSGAILPIAEISRACRARNPSTLILVDGAHSLGLVPLRLSELGCDIFTTSGTKWLLAPEGTGILYIRRQQRRDRQPALWPSVSYQCYEASHPESPPEIIQNILFNACGGRRLPELGTANIISLIGLGAALNEYLRIGPSQVMERVAEMSRRAKTLLAEINGIDLLFDSNNCVAPGIICFRIGQVDSYQDLCQAVSTLEREYGVICRAIPRPPGIRLSIHYFNTETDLRQMANAVRQLALHWAKRGQSANRSSSPSKACAD